MAYLLYVATLLSTIRRIMEFAEQFQRGMTGIERFCEIMDVGAGYLRRAGNAKSRCENVQGDITLRARVLRLCGRPRIHRCLRSSKPGRARRARSVALVGPSGRRQDHAVQPDSPFLRRERPAVSASTGDDVRNVDAGNRCAGTSAWCSRTCTSSPAPSATTSPTARPGATRRGGRRGGQAGRRARVHHRRCTDGYDTVCGRARRPASPAGRSSASPSPGSF